MPRRKMSVTQLTLLTSLSMMGAGIIMLPAKFAEIGAISMLSWIVTALASGAVAYVFAQCGMLSKRMGGLGGFAEYAFGEPGAFLVNYPENRGIYTQSDSPKKSSRNIWSLAVVSVDQRY